MVKNLQSRIFQKNFILGEIPKIPKIPATQSFFGFCQNFNLVMSFFTLKMVHNSVLYDSAKTACTGKIYIFRYGLKCSQPIRFQYSYLWKESMNH